MTDPSSERGPVEELAEEFVERCRRGERPTPAEYAERYPQWAEDILDLFPALLKLEQARPDSSEPGTADCRAAGRGAAPLERLGDYRILREVGRGGMGVVYEAEQESLGRHVALKVLPGHTLLDSRYLLRFQREARAAARLHHTNIVPVYGVGEHDGLHYYVMQFIQGLGLDEVLEELKRLRLAREPRTVTLPAPAGITPKSPGREAAAVDVARSLLSGQFAQPPEGGRTAPPTGSDSGVHLPGQSGGSALSESGRQYWQSVARVGVQVAEALAHAHGQGTVHRDIKPSNLLLDMHGTVWVTDFGLARVEGSGDLTGTGEIVGTLRYLPPERFQGQSDARGDIYSLGLTLYELLTLRAAFGETDRARLMEILVAGRLEPPRQLNPSIPRDLETIVLKATARDPAHRYPSAAELAADLQRFVEDRPIRARRAGRAERLWRWGRRNPLLAGLTAAVAVLLLALAAGAMLLALHFRAAARQEEHLKRDAEDKAEEGRRRLVRLNVEKGVRLMTDGDLAGALVWFAEALKLDQGDLARERVHRLRLAAVLQQCPRPVRLWSCGGRLAHAEFSRDGRYVVTVSDTGPLNTADRLPPDSEVRIWDAVTGRPISSPLKQGGVVMWRPVFSPDGRRVAASYIKMRRLAEGRIGPGGSDVVVWDVATGKQMAAPWKHEGQVRGLGFSADGRRLITGEGRFTPGLALAPGQGEGRVRVWDVATGKPLTGALQHPASVSDVALSPDGLRAVAGDMGGEVRIWEVATGTLLRTLKATEVTDYPLKVSFSPDGRRVLTAGRTGRVWDVATGEAVTPVLEHPNITLSHALFSPDGRRLLTAGWQTVRVWDAATGKPVTGFLTQGSNIESVTFNPDGNRVIAGRRWGGAGVGRGQRGCGPAAPLPSRAGACRGALPRRPVRTHRQ
jgi:serine/threonine protein kinase/DNA-binding beta-propeller fold protein YncE